MLRLCSSCAIALHRKKGEVRAPGDDVHDRLIVDITKAKEFLNVHATESGILHRQILKHPEISNYPVVLHRVPDRCNHTDGFLR